MLPQLPWAWLLHLFEHPPHRKLLIRKHVAARHFIDYASLCFSQLDDAQAYCCQAFAREQIDDAQASCCLRRTTITCLIFALPKIAGSVAGREVIRKNSLLQRRSLPLFNSNMPPRHLQLMKHQATYSALEESTSAELYFIHALSPATDYIWRLLTRPMSKAP